MLSARRFIWHVTSSDKGHDKHSVLRMWIRLAMLFDVCSNVYLGDAAGGVLSIRQIAQKKEAERPPFLMVVLIGIISRRISEKRNLH